MSGKYDASSFLCELHHKKTRFLHMIICEHKGADQANLLSKKVGLESLNFM